MSQFIQSFVNWGYVDLALECWWLSKLLLMDWDAVAWSGLLQWKILVLVCRCLLLGDAGTSAAGLLQVWLGAVSLSCGICQGLKWEDQRWSLQDFLKLALKRADYDFWKLSLKRAVLERVAVIGWQLVWGVLDLQVWLVGSNVDCWLLGEVQILCCRWLLGEAQIPLLQVCMPGETCSGGYWLMCFYTSNRLLIS